MNSPVDTERSALKRWAIVSIVATAVALVMFALLGKSVMEKLLTDLFMPIGVLWMALTVLCVVLLKRKQRMPLLLATLAWCLCFAAGNSFVSNWMMSSLENEYYGIDPLAVAPLDTVVLLGGATYEAPNGQVQVNQNGDRVVLAARMYHRGLAGRIICTGARIKGLSTSRVDEAEASRILLVDLGVPEASIESYGGRNTSEEMQQIAQQLDPRGRVGIITSAFHLPRAMRLASNTGINAVPLPANFNSGQRDEPIPLGQIIRRCIPNQSAVSTNTRVMKEHLARLVGR